MFSKVCLYFAFSFFVSNFFYPYLETMTFILIYKQGKLSTACIMLKEFSKHNAFYEYVRHITKHPQNKQQL